LHNSDSDSTSRLVRLAQQGSASAAEQLLGISYPRLLRSARRLVRSDESAKDVVQEALLKISQNLGGLRNPNAYDAWSKQILKRCCIAHFRREARLREVSTEVDDLPIDAAAADPGAAEAGRRADLIEAVASLGKGSREVVRMHYFFGFSVKEIAAAVQASVGAVKVRLYRARIELRAALAVPDGAIARRP
jgi:RNA polymerase sigma factor (sigma-70 family)